jgi:hypothetical protein
MRIFHHYLDKSAITGFVRSGNTHTASGATEMIKEIVAKKHLGFSGYLSILPRFNIWCRGIRTQDAHPNVAYRKTVVPHRAHL